MEKCLVSEEGLRLRQDLSSQTFRARKVSAYKALRSCMYRSNFWIHLLDYVFIYLPTRSSFGYKIEHLKRWTYMTKVSVGYQ